MLAGGKGGVVLLVRMYAVRFSWRENRAFSILLIHAFSRVRAMRAAIGSVCVFCLSCVQNQTPTSTQSKGDAIHAFPPDLGAGVNLAFEDVLDFIASLDQAGGKCVVIVIVGAVSVRTGRMVRCDCRAGDDGAFGL